MTEEANGPSNAAKAKAASFPDLESDLVASITSVDDHATCSGDTITDVLDAITPENFIEDELSWKWLPEVSSTGADELDELIAVSLRPSLVKQPSAASKMPHQTTISPRCRMHKGRISRKDQIQALRSTVSELSLQLQDLRTESTMGTLTGTASSSPHPYAVNQHVVSILTKPQSRCSCSSMSN
ncbi:unnamed protein product [Phytophthora lilii]|uniref:Unnamed protein product n=1 Tax=Phytophthora lilii TaxID=2077276 RepID=A0A9W7DA45_9STRA|nr:unnamed protein product [Phytophthora lilii]